MFKASPTYGMDTLTTFYAAGVVALTDRNMTLRPGGYLLIDISIFDIILQYFNLDLLCKPHEALLSYSSIWNTNVS